MFLGWFGKEEEEDELEKLEKEVERMRKELKAEREIIASLDQIAKDIERSTREFEKEVLEKYGIDLRKESEGKHIPVDVAALVIKAYLEYKDNWARKLKELGYDMEKIRDILVKAGIPELAKDIDAVLESDK
ncbi:MAG: hypothetical protein B6U76_01445 [Desulfurococcales archaeon ex4484_217_2]|nr:MAG: hypothetical protein B6U76_01445 [Desulfurococcales archaeon ex4484_217_2]